MRRIPTITKNLLIINILAFIAMYILRSMSLGASGAIDLNDIFGLHFCLSPHFHLYQLFTYMFMHANIGHIFFNMFALWMFGCWVEEALGSKKFLFYYIICGVGAGLIQEIAQLGTFYMICNEQIENFSITQLLQVAHNSADVINQWTTVGASGAIYAILLAFGMIYPRMIIGVPLLIVALLALDLVNTDSRISIFLDIFNELFIIAIFLAVFNVANQLSLKIRRFLFTKPIEARWCVIGYIILEFLYFWKNVQGDNIAHLAHLGGVIFGFFLIRHWQKHPTDGYGRSQGEVFFENLRNKWEQRTNKKANTNNYTSSNPDWDYNARKKAQQEEIDHILDKIRKSGYDSLTAEEKRKLFDQSNKR